MSEGLRRALFVDRDGIFNEAIPRNGELTSPRDWSEVKLYPEVEGIASLKELGYLLVMVTNQPDIERGIVPKAFMNEFHEYLRKTYGLDSIYTCLSSSNDDPWKKPNPGMFLQAAKDLSIDLPTSFHLGDTARDVGAARNCGCRSILWDRPYNRDLVADFRVKAIRDTQTILDRQADCQSAITNY